MEKSDKRAPFTATGGIIPPEFKNIKTPCYILDEKALIKNAKLLGNVARRMNLRNCFSMQTILCLILHPSFFGLD